MKKSAMALSLISTRSVLLTTVAFGVETALNRAGISCAKSSLNTDRGTRAVIADKAVRRTK